MKKVCEEGGGKGGHGPARLGVLSVAVYLVSGGERGLLRTLIRVEVRIESTLYLDILCVWFFKPTISYGEGCVGARRGAETRIHKTYNSTYHQSLFSLRVLEFGV